MVEGRAIGRSPDLAFCSLDSSKTVVFVILSVAIECTVCQGRRDETISRMRNRKTGQPACAAESTNPDLHFVHKPSVRKEIHCTFHHRHPVVCVAHFPWEQALLYRVVKGVLRHEHHETCICQRLWCIRCC